jgi:hypothetical protein
MVGGRATCTFVKLGAEQAAHAKRGEHKSAISFAMRFAAMLKNNERDLAVFNDCCERFVRWEGCKLLAEQRRCQ